MSARCGSAIRHGVKQCSMHEAMKMVLDSRTPGAPGPQIAMFATDSACCCPDLFVILATRAFCAGPTNMHAWCSSCQKSRTDGLRVKYAKPRQYIQPAIRSAEAASDRNTRQLGVCAYTGIRATISSRGGRLF
ncbi:hypothetical protein RRG08_052445 [Elysia crispata]|uniref:Uncharacterized protein n=1 Tax=Elysia crispata TaxID=231223 RepID=A0AAE1B2R9_9GAST|nr:hypothetical protein RRG08_052445 [Elysia crispata]